ncbi:fimbria/pilus outer membrane usher protein [Yokenella regensburgei]|uniref:fimbria/pilus outer membrane usher protein n=1 Tax=Yokenella regensburgei TaxID=158877 RepID=UPI001375719A|nr:fimbria/pilus outer membrane usher protein [Yokenella regensburgei]KAF1366570.1 outer membrane usher protein [Yokenella regensburgei]
MEYRRHFLAVGLMLAASHARSAEYRFSPALVNGAGGRADLSLFEQGGQLPGTYAVDIQLNGDRVDSRDVTFSQGRDADGKPSLTPCLSRTLLSGYGVKVEDFPGAGGEDGGCFRVEAIPGAGTTLDFNAQALRLSIPQIYLRPALAGIAPQALWSDGVPALLLNYQASVTRTESRGPGGQDSSNRYVQLSPGANLGAWRLRNTTTWQQTDGRRGRWQSVSTYAERGLNGLKSRLTLGERYTGADIFDSVPFRGAMLASDDGMVPSSQYMYAPVVRGVARTQARVEVRQNGYTVYNRVVAPGPFALTDLNPTGSGGDLQVTVWETDGRPQVFTVPFQTPAVAVKEGYLRYGLMGGQYRPSDPGVKRAPVVQATAMYGLPWGLTAYGGVQAAAHFQATSLGLGVALGDWGAVSADVTQSRGQRWRREDERGRSLRVRYSKQVVATNTTLTLADYRYDQNGYNTLSDVLDTWREDSRTGGFTTDLRKKSRTGLTVSQGLGDWGYLNFSGYRESYRNRPGYDTTINAGYSVPVGDMTVSLNWSQSRLAREGGDGRTDRVTSLWLNVPLRRWLGGNATASWRWTHPSSGGDTHAVGLSGDVWDRRLHWSMSQQYRPDGTGDRNNGALNLAWNGTYGLLSGNYSYASSYRQTGLGLDGGVVAYRHGVTLSQPLGDTVALVEAPGASGVGVGGMPGVRTDFRGYTTQAYLVPYQENTVSLDPSALPPDVDITATDVTVVPTAGAVVPARFATRTGGRALVTLTQADGSPVPFGALATLTQAGGSGVVGSGGQAYLTGLPAQGGLSVKWSGHMCRADYRLPEKAGPGGVYQIAAVCR